MNIPQDELIIVLQLHKRIIEHLAETAETEENKEALTILRDAEETINHIFG